MDVNEYERISTSIFISKLKETASSIIAVLHFTVTAESIIMYIFTDENIHFLVDSNHKNETINHY